MTTVIKFLGMAVAMAKKANEKGENIGKANIKAIEANHDGMHPFASVSACYEGIGAIIAKLGLDPNKTNKEAVKSRGDEVKRMKKGYTSWVANSKKEEKEQVQKLFTWQEWKDKAGFTEDENALIKEACKGDPSYMYIVDKNYIAYKITEEESNLYSCYIQESPFKSYSDIIDGIKKVYNNSKGQDGECTTTYKMKEGGSFTFYFKDFMDAFGVWNENAEQNIESTCTAFRTALKEALNNESTARIEANKKIEEANKKKEELKKARENARNAVNNMSLEDFKAFEEWKKAREQQMNK